MADFHFIRPLWLLAFIALALALYLIKRLRINNSGWQQLLPHHLAQVLVTGNSSAKPASLILPFVIGTLCIIALAGPTWKKLPQPVYQLARGSVLIMDMSYSMYSTDLTPNRLTRARYKAIDLLDSLNEGEIGLIAYAGDAFTISPLTEDINNIKLLLPSLSPDLMPELGSNPLAALTLAASTLKNAGHIEGDIYWFTDGIDNEDIQDLTNWSREHGYRLNIMGVGTLSGAPIKLSNGELMKDDNGAIIIPKLTEASLQGVADRGRGNYARLANSGTDIKHLIREPITQDEDKKTQSEQTGDQWQEFGPYLLLAVLPLVLGYFRRGSLLALFPLILFLNPTQPVYADFWTDLWKTKDQQGQQQYNQQEFEQAAKTFENPLWQGSAYYQAGDYQQALKAFQQGNDAEALYNQGNALAKLQQLEPAIDAYKKALDLNPEHADAKANKALLEKLLEQQQQDQKNSDQQQDQEQNKEQNDQQQNQDSNQQQQNGQQNQDQQQDSQQNQQQQNSEQQQNQENQQDSEQQDSQQQQAEQEQSQQKKAQQQEQQTAQEESEQEQSEQERQAQVMQAQQDKETEQKHQQLLNKVTDDPYLLLRNKMQLEYQKRRQNRSSVGVKKKW